VGCLKTLRALVGFYRRSIPDRWYRRSPYLPVPSPGYLAWRIQTAYGSQRPPAGGLWRDLWQFGAWLADVDADQRDVK